MPNFVCEKCGCLGSNHASNINVIKARKSLNYKVDLRCHACLVEAGEADDFTKKVFDENGRFETAPDQYPRHKLFSRSPGHRMANKQGFIIWEDFTGRVKRETQK